MIVMNPAPIPHTNCELLHRHGLPSISSLGLAGTHVPAGTMVHGWGVKTPSAAAVAEATAGFAIDEHIPKLCTFTLGCMSCMVAAGFPPILHRVCDVTVMSDGFEPKVHETFAPVTTISPTTLTSLLPLVIRRPDSVLSFWGSHVS
jgi:hypothetical protein